MTHKPWLDPKLYPSPLNPDLIPKRRCKNSTRVTNPGPPLEIGYPGRMNNRPPTKPFSLMVNSGPAK